MKIQPPDKQETASAPETDFRQPEHTKQHSGSPNFPDRCCDCAQHDNVEAKRLQAARNTETSFRQPETAQPVSAESVHLSDAEAALYRKLRTRAKRCARIGIALWVIALFVPVYFSECTPRWECINIKFGVSYTSGLSALLYALFLFVLPPLTLISLFPVIGQICLIIRGIVRMGEPSKEHIIGDIFIWIGGIIGLCLLLNSIVIWVWLASAFFVTRAGFLHIEAIGILDKAPPSDTVHAAAENSHNETLADALDDSDSPTQGNPPENRL